MTENIKEALAYAVELREGQEVLYYSNGKSFYDRDKANLVEVVPIKYAETLEVNTLTGLVRFLKEKFDKEGNTPLLVQVDSPTQVNIFSQLNDDRKRESIICAKAELDKFPYGRFMDSETFIINVQSLIQRDLDATSILRCASAIRIEGGADLKDNGISQIATAKIGAATVGEAEVPSPAELRPYRTFLEVEQPTSSFVFRLNKNGDCALFPADGGLWKYKAMENIEKYLVDNLENEINEGYLSIIA